MSTQTTTDMTPEEIHEIGLREVARIEGEMLQIAKKLGFNDLKTLQRRDGDESRGEARSRGSRSSTLYRKYTDQMYAKLPQLFGRLPKARVEVVPMPAFREKDASGAAYDTGRRTARVRAAST